MAHVLHNQQSDNPLGQYKETDSHSASRPAELFLCLGLVILPIDISAIQLANSNRHTGWYNSGFHSVRLLAANKSIRQLSFSQSFPICDTEVKYKMNSQNLFRCV